MTTDRLSFAESLAKPSSRCVYCGKRLKYRDGDLNTIVGLGTLKRSSHCRACGRQQPERESAIEALAKSETGRKAGSAFSNWYYGTLPAWAERQTAKNLAKAAAKKEKNMAKKAARSEPVAAAPAPMWREGDVVNGHRLENNVWVPVS